MPLVVEHLRDDEQVQHRWTMDLTLVMSHLIEEDGGPTCAHGTGYGIYAEREMVDHSFTLDYTLPADEPNIKKGDRIRMWRGPAHG
jgi:hypothetical protein